MTGIFLQPLTPTKLKNNKNTIRNEAFDIVLIKRGSLSSRHQLRNVRVLQKIYRGIGERPNILRSWSLTPVKTSFVDESDPPTDVGVPTSIAVAPSRMFPDSGIDWSMPTPRQRPIGAVPQKSGVRLAILQFSWLARPSSKNSRNSARSISRTGQITPDPLSNCNIASLSLNMPAMYRMLCFLM
jgi:hypothetical protein